MPLPLSLILLCTAGLFALTLKRRYPAYLAFILGLTSLIAFSSEPVSGALSQHLERQYPSFKPQAQAPEFKPAYIMVLGNYGLADPDLAVTGQLSSTALARFSEAFRLIKLYPGAQLVVSGSGFGDIESHAQLMARLAQSFGVANSNIIRFDKTKDTADEIQQLGQLVQGKDTILVTSAMHMPRAMALSQQYNVEVVPAPADYKQRNGQGSQPVTRLIPSAHYLQRSTLAMHEYIGMAWAKLRQPKQ